MNNNVKKILLSAGILAGAGGLTTMLLQDKYIVQHTAHWKIVPPGGYWNYPCSAGDTLYLNGDYTYMSFGGVNGEPDKPIVVLGDNATLKNGFNFSDCNYWHITGKINIKNAPGTALSISGKSNHFEIDGVNIDTAFYFLWFKTEVGDHPCDSSYWHNMNMDDLYVHDCNFHYARQDGCYIGSTGQNADRAVNCNGKIYYPMPATVSNIRFERVRMTNAQRTFLQISGCSGNNYVKNCYFNNCGFEFNPYQGAGVALGGNDNGNYEIAYDTIKNTYLNNFYSYASGTINFHHNLLDSADVVSGKINTQQNASVLLRSNGSTYNFYSNKIGWSNNNVSLVVYGDDKTVSPESIFADNTIAGEFQNFTGVEFKTNIDDNQGSQGRTAIKEIKVTIENIDGSYKKVTGWQKITEKNGNVNITDSNGHFEKYKIKKTDAGNPVIQSKFGLMQAQSSQTQTTALLEDNEITLVRVPVYFSKETSNSAVDYYLNNGFSVAINFNYAATATPVAFPTDSAMIQDKAEQFFSHYQKYLSQIPVVVVENEWDNGIYLDIGTGYHKGSIQDYLNELSIIAGIAHKYGFKVADAGITDAAIKRWYAGQLNIDEYITGVKNITIDFINMHWYVNANGAYDFDLRTIAAKYKDACSKKYIISNEFGMRINDQALWTKLIDGFRGFMPIAIAYSGVSDPKKAIRLSDEMLKELK